MKIVPLPIIVKHETFPAKPSTEAPATTQPSEESTAVKEEKPAGSGKKAAKKEKTPSKPKASSAGNANDCFI